MLETYINEFLSANLSRFSDLYLSFQIRLGVLTRVTGSNILLTPLGLLPGPISRTIPLILASASFKTAEDLSREISTMMTLKKLRKKRRKMSESALFHRPTSRLYPLEM